MTRTSAGKNGTQRWKLKGPIILFLFDNNTSIINDINIIIINDINITNNIIIMFVRYALLCLGLLLILFPALLQVMSMKSSAANEKQTKTSGEITLWTKTLPFSSMWSDVIMLKKSFLLSVVPFPPKKTYIKTMEIAILLLILPLLPKRELVHLKL